MDEPIFTKNSRKSDRQIWISEFYLEVCKSYHNTNLAELSIAVKFLKDDCRQTKYSTILNNAILICYSFNLVLPVKAFLVSFRIFQINFIKVRGGMVFILTNKNKYIVLENQILRIKLIIISCWDYYARHIIVWTLNFEMHSTILFGLFSVFTRSWLTVVVGL